MTVIAPPRTGGWPCPHPRTDGQWRKTWDDGTREYLCGWCGAVYWRNDVGEIISYG